MKKLLLLAVVVLGMTSASAQVFKNIKTGQTVDIGADLNAGELVTYTVVQQGIFVTKTIDVDYEHLMTITKKVRLQVPGQDLKKKQITLSVVLKTFRNAGYEIESRQSYTRFVGQYVQNVTELNFIRK